ncbi:hypothetical protein Leryth_018874 [Lithospermum erythrorhizon]|nr:hypothetical protein Leryth_018874 [Lithospermum erythrorhizon]
MDDKEGGTSSDWSELTQECLFNILNRLTLEQRWQGPLFVCKSWHQSCQDPYLNLVINLESKFNSVRELAWFWTPQFETKIDGMVISVVVWSDGLVREIKVRHCSDHGLALVAQRCPNLEVLSVKSCPRVTDETIAAIALNCPKLRELDVSYCYEISHRSLALIGQHCPNLRILRRNFMNWMDPSQHVGIVPGDYRAIGGLSSGLAMICEGCQDLEYLDISGWAHVTSRDIMNATSTLKNLEDIKKPNFYIPRSVFHTERYGHWQLYDERFQTDAFRI